jgi:predicted GIY-YIG superfamily endonuclease
MVDPDIPSSDSSGNPVSSQAYVYVIAAGSEAAKIGIAKNVQSRLKSLQTGQHRKLVIAHEIAFSDRCDAYAVECRAHRILKGELMEGEWFAVSPEEARQAIDQAIKDLREERERRKQVEKEARAYVAPEWIEAPPWVKDGIDAVSFVVSRGITGDKKEYLVDTGDTIIFVSCRKDPKTDDVISFSNDVTHLYVAEQVA